MAQPISVKPAIELELVEFIQDVHMFGSEHRAIKPVEKYKNFSMYIQSEPFPLLRVENSVQKITYYVPMTNVQTFRIKREP